EAVRATGRADSFDSWSAGLLYLHARHSRRNVALTALAVAAHEELYGALPRSLPEVADLAPEQGLDPLTGEPLRYERTENGARIRPAAWAERVEHEKPGEDSLFVWTLR